MLRLVLLIDGLLIAGLAIAWLATGRKGYLRWSIRLLLVSTGLALLFFIALFISRL